MRMLDKTKGDKVDYHEFGRINDEFMEALRARPEITGVVYLFSQPIILNMSWRLTIRSRCKKGVSIGKGDGKSQYPDWQYL